MSEQLCRVWDGGLAAFRVPLGVPSCLRGLWDEGAAFRV